MEDMERCDADEVVGGGDAATTIGSWTPDCRPDDRFDPRRVVGVRPMIIYRGVGDDAECHGSFARVGVPMSTYGGSRLNTITKIFVRQAQFKIVLLQQNITQ